MFCGGGPALSLVSRACFGGACFAGPWSRDPVPTVADGVELHVFYECFVIAHAIGSANANVIVNTNAGASANVSPNVSANANANANANVNANVRANAIASAALMRRESEPPPNLLISQRLVL